LSLCLELGRGHFNAPGIKSHRLGLHWAPVLKVEKVTATDCLAAFILIDPEAGLQLNI